MPLYSSEIGLLQDCLGRKFDLKMNYNDQSRQLSTVYYESGGGYVYLPGRLWVMSYESDKGQGFIE